MLDVEADLETVRTRDELRAAVERWRAQGAVIGLAPTMGNLHEGHLALIDTLRRAGAERIVASIFVNPTQFGPNEDFATYPRTFEADRLALEARGVDLLFAPEVAEIYPETGLPEAQVDMPALSSDLCGAFRPGHFRGVLTVVAKLLNLAGPDLAAFGEKDYQQLVMIEAMVESLDIPVRIVRTPTVRDTDGVALSSRNHFLNADERQSAPELHRTLEAAARALEASQPVPAVETQATERLATHGFTVDYVAVRDARDLSPVTAPAGELVVLAAAPLGQTRLIDNVKVRVG